jgi:hypothetical protein
MAGLALAHFDARAAGIRSHQQPIMANTELEIEEPTEREKAQRESEAEADASGSDTSSGEITTSTHHKVDHSKPLGGCDGFLLTSDQQKIHWNLSQPIIFLKTHKTGSSTLANIFYRMADWRGLNCMLPMEKEGVDGQYLNYPGPFPGGDRDDKPMHQYDMIAAHAVWSPKMLDWVKANPKLITILRNPMDRWLSHWDFQRAKHGGCGTETDNSKKLTQLLETQLLTKDCSALQRGGSIKSCADLMRLCANQMAYDLGYYPLYGVREVPSVSKFVQKVEERFDLVMITEMFEESLVLLKQELGVPIEEVYAGHFKEDTDSRTKVTAVQKEMIHTVTNVDRKLYSHFRSTLEARWHKQAKVGKVKGLLRQLKQQAKTVDAACEANEPVCSAALRTDVGNADGYHAHLRERERLGAVPCGK